MSGLRFGYMNVRLERLASEVEALSNEASFVEIQIHDELKKTGFAQWPSSLPESFKGDITIHGEGETDGKRKICFASRESTQRTTYLKETLRLFTAVIEEVRPWRTRRVVIHPDSMEQGEPRYGQIRFIAQSLEKMRDQIENVEICLEPRGGVKQGKVVRLDLDDLKALSSSIHSTERIGICIDLAQLFVTYGNAGAIDFLRELPRTGLPVKEIHASDVIGAETGINRVAMEIGNGGVDWLQIIPLLAGTCREVLIETLGGVPVFRRSKSFIEGLDNEKILLRDSA